MPGGHVTVSTSPSNAVRHSSVARHAGDEEEVRDGDAVRVPVRVPVKDAVPVRVRLNVLDAVREADAPRVCVRVMVGERDGVLVADGTTHVSSADRYCQRPGHRSTPLGALKEAMSTGSTHDVAPRGHAALTTARLDG
jgi:hypothetical protein